MTLKQTIQAEKIKAMKDKNKERNEVLSLIMAEIKQIEVDTRNTELSQEQVESILKKMVKTREESSKIFKVNGREDLAAKEEFQLSIIFEFLPKQLTSEEVDAIINKVMSQVEEKTIKTLMPLLKKELDGKANMREVQEKIKKLLN
jgi:hypothetical protein